MKRKKIDYFKTVLITLAKNESGLISKPDPLNITFLFSLLTECLFSQILNNTFLCCFSLLSYCLKPKSESLNFPYF